MTPWLLSLKTLLLPPSLQNKFRTLSNVWKMVCKKGSQLIPSLYAYAVLYDFPTAASKRWNLFFHPWNLALVIWLALVNGKLENCDVPETYRVFAHWDLPSLDTFGLQSQPMWRSPCFHPGEWGLLESGAEPQPLEQGQQTPVTDQVQPALCFGIAWAKSVFMEKH